MHFNKLKWMLLGMSSLVSVSALALNKDITVSLVVDNSMSMVQPDGSAIPDTKEMTFAVGTGLRPITIPVVLSVSDATKKPKINIGLNYEAKLTNDVDGRTEIPLKVSLNNNMISTAASPLELGSKLSLISGGNKTLPINLVIEPSGSTDNAKAGHYQGVVSLTMTPSA